MAGHGQSGFAILRRLLGRGHHRFLENGRHHSRKSRNRLSSSVNSISQWSFRKLARNSLSLALTSGMKQQVCLLRGLHVSRCLPYFQSPLRTELPPPPGARERELGRHLLGDPALRAKPPAHGQPSARFSRHTPCPCVSFRTSSDDYHTTAQNYLKI